MNSGNPRQDSLALTNQFLDGTISEADLESLGNRLLVESSLRRDFAEFCQLHIDLSQESVVTSSADHAMQQFLSSCLPASTTPKVLKQNVLLSSSRKWSRISAATLCGIVACSIAFVLGGLWWTVRPDLATIPLQRNNSDSATAAFTATSITLPSGSSTRMHFDKVGYATIHGPATFQMLGPMRARLDSGRIRMRVTEKTGHGFVVETPDGDITDLGTEFGVNVMSGNRTALAVFEGAVDLQVADQKTLVPRVERLVGGDGVLFNKGGQMNRLNSIMTSSGAKFEVCGEESPVSFDDPLIVDMYDNLPSGTTKRYYEIVTKGMAEDALAYVDRLEHNWNGLSSEPGMPRYLREADYVKTFCDDKRRNDPDFKLTVVVKRPTTLYVLYDRRLEVPRWLSQSFYLTNDRIGMDTGKRFPGDDKQSGVKGIAGIGPGQSIDLEFDVWKRAIDKPGPVILGPNGVNRQRFFAANMYGVVAVALPVANAKRQKPSNHRIAEKPESLGVKE
jgi:hypothetical protein